MNNSLTIKLLNENAKVPTQATSVSAGFDLYASQQTFISAEQTAFIPTGLQVILPPNTYLRIADTSSKALVQQLFVKAGVIDPDYTGEIKVVLFNANRFTSIVLKHERIAQGIITPYISANFNIIDSNNQNIPFVYSQLERNTFCFGQADYIQKLYNKAQNKN
jgi:dUTP pyrophosphatase